MTFQVDTVLLKLSPVPIAFILGYIVQRRRVLNRDHAASMLKLVVYYGLPVLIFISIGQMHLRADLSLITATSVTILLLTWPAVTLAGRLLGLARPTMGSFVTGPMIMNQSLFYPIVIVAWGTEGFAYQALFDFGNALVALTLVHVLSCRYGADRTDWWDIARSILKFPPFIALFLALLVNLNDITLPATLVSTLKWSGQAVMLLIPFALGIFLDTRRLFILPAFVAVALRAGLSFVLAWGLVGLFDLQGLIRTIVLFASLAPVGHLSLVYAAKHHLDREFTASIASLSLIAAMIYVPLALQLLH